MHAKVIASVLAAATRVRGWVLHSPCSDGYAAQASCDESWPRIDIYDVAKLWSLPSGGEPSSDGLAAGITYALHPQFCHQMLPRFREMGYSFLGPLLSSPFVSCDDIREARPSLSPHLSLAPQFARMRADGQWSTCRRGSPATARTSTSITRITRRVCPGGGDSSRHVGHQPQAHSLRGRLRGVLGGMGGGRAAGRRVW